MRVAIDVGGTFTDVLLFDEKSGHLHAIKTASTPPHPSHCFMEGLYRALNQADSKLQAVSLIVHGTTIVTNTLLQGKTARVGLLVSKGFRDLLEIGRQSRPALYDLQVDRIPPLVPRNLVREIHERLDDRGRTILPLDKHKTHRQIQGLSKAGIESLAIVLLFSFLNPRHEEELCKIARKFLPKQFIFLSSQVSPEFREYERASTTAVAASVAPKVISYLGDIQDNLNSRGWHHDRLTIMHSGGGTLPSKEAVKRPHVMVESGPAAGIIASAQLARSLGLKRAIGFDMGGTTAKAGLILDGHPQYTTDYEVGGRIHQGGRSRGNGYPVRFPMIDLAECGAGAGSMAWIDDGGHLQVGPQSAGADPGPACYGKGGKNPTVTDAYLALGYLDAESFLGGEMKIYPDLTRKALAKFICKPMNRNTEEAADGILTIANSNILRILRLISVSRGFDPRDFTLISYGGAGPLHATSLAKEMSIRKVVIPCLPGLFSALGLLYADVSTDFVKTVMMTLSRENLDRINKILSWMKKMAESWFKRLKVPPDSRHIRASADLRYVRQNFELSIFLPNLRLCQKDIHAVQNAFHKAHEENYGHSILDETIQAVNLRLLAVKRVEKPKLHPIARAFSPLDQVPHRTRKVWLVFGSQKERKRFKTCRIFDRASLKAGHKINGPAIIQEKESTTLVGLHWKLEVDKFGHLLLEHKD